MNLFFISKLGVGASVFGTFENIKWVGSWWITPIGFSTAILGIWAKNRYYYRYL
jgi:hypothetical protein